MSDHDHKRTLCYLVLLFKAHGGDHILSEIREKYEPPDERELCGWHQAADNALDAVGVPFSGAETHQESTERGPGAIAEGFTGIVTTDQKRTRDAPLALKLKCTENTQNRRVER